MKTSLFVFIISSLMIFNNSAIIKRSDSDNSQVIKLSYKQEDIRIYKSIELGLNMKKAVITGDFENVYIWDFKSGEFSNILYHGKSYGVKNKISLSNDKKIIASYGNVGIDHAVKVWNYSDGKQMLMFTAKGNINDVKFSLNNKLLAAATVYGIYIWDLKSEKLIYLLDKETEYLSVDFDKDSKKIIGGSEFGVNYLWDLKIGKLIKPVGGHSSRVEKLGFIQNDKFIISLPVHDYIKKWNVYDSSPAASLEHKGRVTDFKISNDSKYFAYSSKKKILFVDADSFRILKSVEENNDINSFDISMDNKFLIFTCLDGFIKIYNQDSKKNLTIYHFNDNGWIVFDGDGRCDHPKETDYKKYVDFLINKKIIHDEKDWEINYTSGLTDKFLNE